MSRPLRQAWIASGSGSAPPHRLGVEVDQPRPALLRGHLRAGSSPSRRRGGRSRGGRRRPRSCPASSATKRTSTRLDSRLARGSGVRSGLICQASTMWLRPVEGEHLAPDRDRCRPAARSKQRPPIFGSMPIASSLSPAQVRSRGHQRSNSSTKTCEGALRPARRRLRLEREQILGAAELLRAGIFLAAEQGLEDHGHGLRQRAVGRRQAILAREVGEAGQPYPRTAAARCPSGRGAACR